MDRLKNVFGGATSQDSDTNPVIEVVGGENQSLCPSLRRGLFISLKFVGVYESNKFCTVRDPIKGHTLFWDFGQSVP